MPSADAEVYFIAAMMVLILAISFVAVYFFARQYRKEMREKAENSRRPTPGERSSSAEETDSPRERV